jgi:hypothetical protein
MLLFSWPDLYSKISSTLEFTAHQPVSQGRERENVAVVMGTGVMAANTANNANKVSVFSRIAAFFPNSVVGVVRAVRAVRGYRFFQQPHWPSSYAWAPA